MSNDMPCTVSDCERPAQVLGWCRGHYQRVKRNGVPGPAIFRRSPGPVPAKLLTRQSEPAPCKIEGCDDPVTGRGWCSRHYQRWYRTGDPGPADAPRYGMLDACSAAGCERKHQTHGFCDLHYRRQRRGLRPESPEFVAEPPVFDDNSYGAIHRRLGAVRGLARHHACSCGQPAEQWAYQHNDPDALVSRLGHPYSLHIFDCYEPMCLSCHGRLDKAQARLVG